MRTGWGRAEAAGRDAHAAARSEKGNGGRAREPREARRRVEGTGVAGGTATARLL